MTASGWHVYGARSEAGAPDTVLLARTDGDRITREHQDELRALLAIGPLADRLMNGLERVQREVSALLHFDANESAPPDDERWAQSLYELNEFVTEAYVELENAYAAANGIGPAEDTYTIKVHVAADGGMWAQVVELPGCFASGRTIGELGESIAESIRLATGSDPAPIEVLTPGPVADAVDRKVSAAFGSTPVPGPGESESAR